MARRFIVESDGGSRGNPGPAAYGTVVRDADTGAVVAELAEYLDVVSNNVAEYRGAIAGLEYLRDLDPDATVEMRLDSKLVVEQLSGRWQVKHPDMRVLAKRAVGALAPGQVTYTWVPRAQNRRADALVNEMIDAALARGDRAIRREPGQGAVDGDPAPDDVVGIAGEVAGPTAGVRSANVMVGWADLPTPTMTLLARHGATAYSLERRFSGLGGADLPLSPMGELQAEALAREVARRGDVSAILTSPLLRARQTAALAAQATGLPVTVDEDLAECAFGEWDGATLAEVRARWPRELEAWLGSVDVAPPGGESFAECRERYLRARTRITADHPATRVLVVAHVSPVKVLIADAVGAPLSSVYRMELPPCSISTVSWFPDGNASMMSFAEAGHLHGIGAPPGT